MKEEAYKVISNPCKRESIYISEMISFISEPQWVRLGCLHITEALNDITEALNN